MIQSFSLILWASPRAEPGNEAVDRVLAVCDTLSEFGPELAPRLDATGAQPGGPSNRYEQILELIEQGKNREGNQVFETLGSSLILQSEMQAGIHLVVRNTSPEFKNTLILNFPPGAPILEQEGPWTSDRMVWLFDRLVEVWQPFWGCIRNNRNGRKRYPDSPLVGKNGLPTVVHWLNYLSADMVKRCDVTAVSTLLGVSVRQVAEGLLLQLQHRLLNDDDPEDVEHQRLVTEKLLGHA